MVFYIAEVSGDVNHQRWNQLGRTRRSIFLVFTFSERTDKAVTSAVRKSKSIIIFIYGLTLIVGSPIVCAAREHMVEEGLSGL